MIYNINESLSEFEEKKTLISSIVQDINFRTIEYEKSVGMLKEELIIERSELDLLKSSVVQVRLGDLIEEISWLSEVSIDKVCSLMKFNMLFSDIEELFCFIDNIRDNDVSYPFDNVRFRLYSNLGKADEKGLPFEYFMFLLFDLGSIQKDGKKLIEHCSVQINPFSSGEIDVTFCIDKDINDVICNFNFGGLENQENTSWYPFDLFTQAVINCSQREYNCKVNKVRERVKK